MSTHISVPPQLLLERILTLEIVRVTERAAVSAARLRGHGQEKPADQAAVDAMRRELNKLPIEGTIVIGEGERDEAPMLFIGEKVGLNAGPQVDIAVDPLEGTTLCAKNMPGAIATMAMAEGGTLLNAPDVYMQKIAVGPGYAKGVVELDATPADNVRRLAKAKGVAPSAITVLVLDRPRHAEIIAAIRGTGAAVRLVTDGDVAGVIHCADSDNTGVDMYMGIGGAPEGVLAAAALRCIGGQMQCRLILDTEEKRERAHKMGVKDPRIIYGIEDMARGDCLFAATGVTTGSLLSRRQVPQGQCDRDRDRGDALGDGHRALHQGRTPAARKIPSGLRTRAMAGNVVIRPVGLDERAAWEPLWNGYIAFYKATLEPGASDVAWARFHDPDEPMFLLGAYVDGRLTGIVHYLFHRSTWSAADYCYLQDLFVAEGARGLGLGRALIEAVYEKARAEGASRVYWLTQTTNTTARKLYDQVADNPGFMQYRKLLPRARHQPRHCEEHLRRSNPVFPCGPGLLRFARNDNRGSFVSVPRSAQER